MRQIDPVAGVAIAKAIPAKQLKELEAAIAAGTAAGFTITAEISGRLERSPDTTVKPTASLLNEAILAELIRRLGVTRQAFEVALFEIAMEALVVGIPIRDRLIEQRPELLTVIHMIKKDIVAKLPPQPRAGSIKVLADLQLSRCDIAA